MLKLKNRKQSEDKCLKQKCVTTDKAFYPKHYKKGLLKTLLKYLLFMLSQKKRIKNLSKNSELLGFFFSFFSLNNIPGKYQLLLSFPHHPLKVTHCVLQKAVDCFHLLC